MKLSEANRLRVLYFLVLSCTAAWLPLFADDLKARGFSGLEISVILSITPVTMFLIQPLYGMLADRLGYRLCMVVSSLLAAVAFTFYLFEGTFVSLLLITVFMSVFYNGLQPVLDSLTLQLTEKEPTFSYGTVRIAGALGWALTGIIVGYYIDEISTKVIFIFASASLALTFLISLTLPADQAHAKESTASSLKDVGSIFNDRTMLFFLLSVFLISAAVTTIWNFYSLYMKENGASASLVGFGLSFQGLCEIPLFFFSGRIILKLNLKNTLLLTVAATVLRMFLYSVVKNPQAAIAIELLHGVSWSLFWVVCVEYTNLLVKKEWRATGQSLLYAAYFGVGAIAGNFWTGYLYDLHFTLASIFFMNACIVAVVGVGMILVLKKPGQPVTS